MHRIVFCAMPFTRTCVRALTRNKTEFPQILAEIQLNYLCSLWDYFRFTQRPPKYGIILLYHTPSRSVKRFLENFYGFLALSLFMALTLGADYHNSAVSFDYFALVAHRFYRRSDFHCIFSLLIKLFCRSVAYDLLRHVILPFVKSYGLISNFTVSRSMILI